MPKLIAHALTGASIVAALHPKARVSNFVPLIIGAVLGIAADFDFAFEWVLNSSEVHRGITHSLIFSILIGILFIYFSGSGNEKAAIAYSLAYLSHLILDFLSSTRGGVKLLWPFTDKYYNYGLTNIFELPLGVTFSQVLDWITLEIIIFLPIFVIILVYRQMLK